MCRKAVLFITYKERILIVRCKAKPAVKQGRKSTDLHEKAGLPSEEAARLFCFSRNSMVYQIIMAMKIVFLLHYYFFTSPLDFGLTSNGRLLV